MATINKAATKKQNELNNLIRILQQQNNHITNSKNDSHEEFQSKILLIKEKLQNIQNKQPHEPKNNKSSSTQKPAGFLSHRGFAKYSKEDEYLIYRSKEEKKHKEITKIKEPADALAEFYLLTNEGSNFEHNVGNNANSCDNVNENLKEINEITNNHDNNKDNFKGKKEASPEISKNNNNNMNNSRSLNESDLEKLLNNPNIQPSYNRYDFQNLCKRNNSTNVPTLGTFAQKFHEKHEIAHDNNPINGRKFSLEEMKNKFLQNDLEGKLRKTAKNSQIQDTLKGLKDRITNTLGKYKEKTQKLKDINNFLHNKIKRESIV